MLAPIEAEFEGKQCKSSCKNCPLVASYCANLFQTDSLEFFVKSVSLCQVCYYIFRSKVSLCSVYKFR